MRTSSFFFERSSMTKIKIILLLLGFTLLLAACNREPAKSPVSTPAITIVVNTDSPAVIVQTETAYPISDGTQTPFGTVYPAGKEPTPLPGSIATIGPTSDVQQVPAADPETASVYGVLYSYSDQQLLQHVMIYAADVVIVESSEDKIYTTQEKSSPHIGTDDRGQFTISGIKPGTYFFMMVTPFGNYPIFDENNQTFEIELKAGDVVDFGKTFVNWP